jgi:hypothetical protein
MRRILLAAILLLVAAAAAQARLVQASSAETAERGGQALPRGAKEPGCALAVPAFRAAALPLGPFGWFGPQDTETLVRLKAATRLAIAGEGAAWRRPRIIGRAGLGNRPLVFRRHAPPRLR